MNSVLQVMVRIPFGVAAAGPLNSAMANLRRDLGLRMKALRPGGWAALVSGFGMDVRNQEDAHQFVTLLVDGMRSEEGGAGAGMSSVDRSVVERSLSTSVDRAFGMIVRTQWKCPTCGIADELFERSYTLSLFVPPKATTLVECAREYFSPGEIDRRCEHCGTVGEEMVKYAVPEFMPRILVFHLARFQLLDGEFVKNDARVQLTEELDAARFCAIPVRYRLLGFVSHAGSMQGGHYVSVARHEDRWNLFNDDTVSVLDLPKVWRLQPYVVFYERVDGALPMDPDERDGAARPDGYEDPREAQL
jgi:uncharacterized UBP type Zn finger protein